MMKILIISDVHANWQALEAILDKESYDAMIFLGDVVDFGPNPRNCVKFLMNSAKGRFWGVRGDHDHAMAYGINSKCPGELNLISDITREWGEEFLSSEEVGFLRRLPIYNQFSIDNMDFKLIHGTDIDLDNLCDCEFDDGNQSESSLSGYQNFVLVGHSHKPYIRINGDTTILNPGSVGQPRDSNPRASYAVIEDGVPYIKRIGYDIDKTVNDLQRSTLPKNLINKLSYMLHTGNTLH